MQLMGQKLFEPPGPDGWPEEPEAWLTPEDPECVSKPLRSLNFEDQNIGTLIWATGFQFDYNWLEADALDDRGRPLHQRGVSPVNGLYFVGLPWQSRRGSSFIWGVWHDAKFIADQIAIQENYLTYRPSTP